jgi:hypothetical protein
MHGLLACEFMADHRAWKEVAKVVLQQKIV